MNRSDLERLARSEAYMHRLTRDDLQDIVRMLERQDEVVRTNTTNHQAVASRLVSDVRGAARQILDAIDSIADDLERTR